MHEQPHVVFVNLLSAASATKQADLLCVCISLGCKGPGVGRGYADGRSDPLSRRGQALSSQVRGARGAPVDKGEQSARRRGQ